MARSRSKHGIASGNMSTERTGERPKVECYRTHTLISPIVKFAIRESPKFETDFCIKQFDNPLELDVQVCMHCFLHDAKSS
jgi:hypothetical protein